MHKQEPVGDSGLPSIELSLQTLRLARGEFDRERLFFEAGAAAARTSAAAKPQAAASAGGWRSAFAGMTCVAATLAVMLVGGAARTPTGTSGGVAHGNNSAASANSRERPRPERLEGLAAGSLHQGRAASWLAERPAVSHGASGAGTIAQGVVEPSTPVSTRSFDRFL